MKPPHRRIGGKQMFLSWSRLPGSLGFNDCAILLSHPILPIETNELASSGQVLGLSTLQGSKRYWSSGAGVPIQRLPVE